MDRRLARQVIADILGGERAYLLGWERLPAMEGGGWGARICWVEMTNWCGPGPTTGTVAIGNPRPSLLAQAGVPCGSGWFGLYHRGDDLFHLSAVQAVLLG